MTAQELAVKAWDAVGDGRAYGDLPEDYRFKLQETAKCVLEGKEGGIEGLQEFEAKAVEIKNTPPKPEKKSDDVPETLADTATVAVAAKQGKLPDDFPGVAALNAAGISTYAQLRHAGDVNDIEGIGPATAAKIEEALNS